MKTISRRDFLAASASTAIGAIGFPYIVSSSSLGANGGTAASERVTVGCIGVGGQGTFDMRRVMEGNDDVQMVAVCDVEKENPRYLGGGFTDKWEHGTGGCLPAKKRVEDYYSAKAGSGAYKGCQAYTDFRELIAREDIDAVVVGTTDHWHALCSAAAAKSGKHVYCEKPLTHSVYEARKLAEICRQAGVATQMGNQGHSSEDIRLICEWIWAGAIGNVTEVHAWTDRPVWPQGIDRPKDTPPVPDTLDWNMWLGPAPERPYNAAYHPFDWRGWWDFGTGVMGDMGCHIIDPVAWALKLGHPVTIQASYTATNYDSAPKASTIHYEFPAREDMPPVKLHWYTGGLTPERPAELEEGRKLGGGDGNGVLFVGDKGKLMCGCYAAGPRIIPETKMRAFLEAGRPEKIIPRSKRGPHGDWINACKGEGKASSNFDVSGPLTEIVLLGNLAIQCPEAKEQILKWDGDQMKVTNIEAANKYVNPPYRGDWTL